MFSSFDDLNIGWNHHHDLEPHVRIIQNTLKQTQTDAHPNPWELIREDIPNCKSKNTQPLTTETVKGTTLSLKSIYYVKRGDSLSLCVLSVCDCITNNTLQEGL